MYTIISVIITVLVIAFIACDFIKACKRSSIETEDNYKRWSEDELFVAAYIACFVEDDVRLNDAFQKLLAKTLRRTERAVNEKIRRLSTVGAQKSDASELDMDTIYNIAQMNEVEAFEKFEGALALAGASTRQQRAIAKYL